MKSTEGAVKQDTFDLLIIGAGSAGFAAAIKASDLGANVGLIEGGTMGGTCVNVGCVPSKTLIRAAELHHRVTQHAFQGIPATSQNPSWNKIRHQKDELIQQLRQAKYADVLKNYPHVHYIEGKATLVSDHEVLLSQKQKLKADKIIVTTGAHSWEAPIPGLRESGFLNSTDVMNLETLPKSMVVIGASAVGLELAQVLSRLGVAITILEALPRIVPLEDEDISEQLEKYLTLEGMKFFVGAKILNVEKNPQGYNIHIEAQGHPQQFQSEALFVATGRRPNTEGLGLETIGIEKGKKGHVLTNEYLQTKVPHIYAAGDCTSEVMFVYVSAYSGALAAENALKGNRLKFDVSILPKVTFTDPQVASVGLTENEAKQRGYEAVSAKITLDHIPRALAARDTRGFLKLVADRKTQKLLGAHFLASEAGELIEVPTLAIKFGITVDDLVTTFFPYLTQSEGIKLCAQMFNKDVKKLSCCAA